MRKRDWLAIRFGMMNYKANEEVDKFVNDLLDKRPTIDPIKIRKYTMTLRVPGNTNGIEIWVENKWYGYASTGYLTGLTERLELWNNQRPQRKTLLRLARYREAHVTYDKLDLDIDKLLPIKTKKNGK